jgi:predicted nucleic acid-binding protein
VASASIAAGLIDTDILIDASKGIADGIAFLTHQQSVSGLQISMISAMELIAGCRNRTELASTHQFLQRFTVWPVSANISRTALQLMESFFLSHGLVIPDALIAATALEYGLSLYTRNSRHFQMIPTLSVVRPY